MKIATRTLLGTIAAALMVISLGCQPPKPPAPETGGSVTTGAGDNTTVMGGGNITGNTTAGTETPLGETP